VQIFNIGLKTGKLMSQIKINNNKLKQENVGYTCRAENVGRWISRVRKARVRERASVTVSVSNSN